MASEEEVERRLLEHAEEIHRFVARHAGPRLVKFEAVEDLVQGVHVEALRSAANFTYRSDPEFFAWLYGIARRYLYDRHAHWYAAKRGAGRVLRFAEKETGAFETRFGLDPVDTATSPSSFASRREQVVLVTRAMTTLLPRDQELLRLSSEGVSIQDIAQRLGISYDAAERARLRALDRLRKAHRVLLKAFEERPGG